MFTGIITDLGSVREVLDFSETRFEITTKYSMESIPIGASIRAPIGLQLMFLTKRYLKLRWDHG